MDALGTTDMDFFNGLVDQLARATSHGAEVNEEGINFMLSIIKDIEPRDQLEAMLAAQMAAVHIATMTFARRGETEPEDLSANLIVQLGVVTEPLNRQWFERNTGQTLKDVQSWVRHPVNRWMAATLDGVVEGTGAVFEAKFMLPWSFSEEDAAEKYMPQLQHNMWVTNAKDAVLSITRAAANGSRSPSRLIPFTSTCFSPLRRSFGGVLRSANPLA
jgi:hypothetical protein